MSRPETEQESETMVTLGRKGKGKGKGKGKDTPAPEKFTEELWEEPREAQGLKLLGEVCTEIGTAAWKYPLMDNSRRCFVGFLKNPFSVIACQAFFETVRDNTNWVQPEGPLGPMPRKTAWY